ncbi:grasp-with-spasm system ATP-grasp peptide maturase [Psychroserpens sp. MEBiC05023]
MVLILSEKNDFSTTEIIDWLLYYDIPFLKITNTDKVKIEWVKDDIILLKDGVKYPVSEFKSYWYRRGQINDFMNAKSNDPFIDLINIEHIKLKEFLYYKLSKIKKINSIERSDVNKLIVSSVAREVGLLAADDYIVNSKKELLKIIDNKNKFSTKSISGHAIHVFDNLCSYYYTVLVDKEKIENNYDDTFFPSLVQSYIEKKYELRVFYLNNKMYSMAIFSQNDSQTSIDFRNYNRVKPNRTVPFKLPFEIEKKLNLLMKKLNINCGSIDIIVTPKDEYYFLELNPIGQFGMVSKPCNYNLEKILTDELINYIE